MAQSYWEKVKGNVSAPFRLARQGGDAFKEKLRGGGVFGLKGSLNPSSPFARPIDKPAAPIFGPPEPKKTATVSTQALSTGKEEGRVTPTNKVSAGVSSLRGSDAATVQRPGPEIWASPEGPFYTKEEGMARLRAREDAKNKDSGFTSQDPEISKRVQSMSLQAQGFQSEDGSETRREPRRSEFVSEDSYKAALDKYNRTGNWATPTVSQAAGAGANAGTGVSSLRAQVSPEQARIDALRKGYLSTLGVSSEERKLADELAAFRESAGLGVSALEGQGRGIPLGLVRGQQAQLQEQAGIKEQSYLERLGLAQQNRLAQQQAAQAALGFAEKDQAAQLAAQQEAASANQPIEIGGALVQLNPQTGRYETVYQAPQTAAEGPTSVQEYQFAQQSGYQGSYTDFLAAKAAYSQNPANLQFVSPTSTFGGGTFDPNTGTFTPAQVSSDSSVINALQDKVDLINTLLTSPGLAGSVGPYGISRWTPFTADAGARQEFAAGVNQLINQETIDTLLDLKSKGGTLGALSDQERVLLQGAASKIGTWMQRDKNGNPTGKFEVSEDAFIAELNKIKELANKAIERAGGSAATDQMSSPEAQNLRNAGFSDEEIREYLGFSGVPSTTQNGSIQLGSNLARQNNNPGNLRFAGQSGATQGAGGFARFSTPQAGYNALLNQIQLDESRGHTLQSFISKYAPSSENDTEQYISQMVQWTGYPATTPLSQIDKNALAKAMIRKESSSTIG